MPTPATTRRNFPTLRYLAAPFRWLLASRRRATTAGAVVLGLIAAPVLWWWIQLTGLPDIGDPFDVSAYRSRTIPDDRNACVLYDQARAKLVPMPKGIPRNGPRADVAVAWSKADPKLRSWAESNREAMELYRRGAERPDALAADRRPTGESFAAFQSLQWLVMLEASRLEEQGDMAGAWTWYRTALRASYHFGGSGSRYHRLTAIHQVQAAIRPRLESWAIDPRTTRAVVQRALDDVVACGDLVAVGADSLEQEYRDAMKELDDTNGAHSHFAAFAALPLRGFFAQTGMTPAPEQLRPIGDAWRSWRGEPERSRRVLRLAFANWLAYYALPPDRRPQPDPEIPGPVRFYDLGPDAPANARALSSRALHRWFESTTDARALFQFYNPMAHYTQEARGYRALVVLLGCELYRRDHGQVPIRDEDLVGPYLKALPDDGLDGPGVVPEGTR